MIGPNVAARERGRAIPRELPRGQGGGQGGGQRGRPRGRPRGGEDGGRGDMNKPYEPLVTDTSPLFTLVLANALDRS
jgi:hypothetical protein